MRDMVQDLGCGLHDGDVLVVEDSVAAESIVHVALSDAAGAKHQKCSP